MATPPPLPPTGSPAPETPPGAAASGPDLRRQAQAAGQDALQALKLYLGNPIGDLGRAFETLGPKRAFAAGVVFGVVSIVAVIVGLLLSYRGYDPGFGGFLRTLLRVVTVGLISFGVLVAAILGARTALAGKGSLEGDVFVAGAAQLPVGVWVLLSGILGPRNYDLILVVGAFALCYATFALFGGCTKVSGISERRATPAVPAIIVVTFWLARVILQAVV
jgi:hypothetical protein